MTTGDGLPTPAPPPPPPRALTGTSLERTRAVVDEVLAKAGKDGERVVSYARLLLGGTITVLWPAATWDEMQAGEISDFGVVGVSLAAVVFSLAMLWRLRTKQIGPVMRFASILADAALVLGILATFVLHPPPAYYGLGRISGIGAAYFAVLAAGIRLSKRGALLSVAAFFAGVGALVYVDQTKNGVVDTVANWVTIATLVGTAGVFAWLIASRTQKLVLEGAAQSLLAERARSRLGSYVSEEVAERALASDVMRMGGVRQEVAILFSDLRGFTTSSEKADPEQIVRELNEYFEVMVAAVQAEGGVVDKYIGDSIMAVFGAPTTRPDDAARAVKAAFRMEQALEKLNVLRGKRGLPPLKHGIGVHVGTAVAGNIGTASRAQYTVIGDTVNVAARLESCTKDAGVSVLVSRAVVDKIAGADGLPPLVDAGEVKAKGREEKIAVHTFG
jgi:class 3 adenylate cyclase